METKRCPRCGELNSATARFCKKCGARLYVEPTSNMGKTSKSSASALSHKQFLVKLRRNIKQVKLSKKSPELAAFLSFIFPGAGQIYGGKTNRGIILFLFTVLGMFFIVGIFVWLVGIYDAYTLVQEYNTKIDMKIKSLKRSYPLKVTIAQCEEAGLDICKEKCIQFSDGIYCTRDFLDVFKYKEVSISEGSTESVSTELLGVEAENNVSEKESQPLGFNVKAPPDESLDIDIFQTEQQQLHEELASSQKDVSTESTNVENPLEVTESVEPVESSEEKVKFIEEAEQSENIPEEPSPEQELLNELSLDSLSSTSAVGDTKAGIQDSEMIGEFRVLEKIFDAEIEKMYRVVDDMNNRYLLVKFNDDFFDSVEKEKFQEAVQKWKRRYSPILLQLVSYSHDDLFYVTEHAEKTLLDLIESEKIEDIDVAIETILEIAKLIETYHRTYNQPYGVLRLNSVFINEDRFYLGKPFMYALRALHQPNDLMQYQFIAPEQHKLYGDGTSFPTDIWQLGVLFYVLVTKNIFPWGKDPETTKQQKFATSLSDETMESDISSIIAEMTSPIQEKRPTVAEVIKRIYML